MSIKIYSWNVNGIRALSKKNVLEWIEYIKPDILCFQEIKAIEKEVPSNINKGYTFSIVNSGKNKGLSGTLTYSNIPLSNSNFCEFVDSNSEGRIIEHHYNDIIIFNVYFPNGKTSKTRLNFKIKFFNKFYKYCEKLRKEGKSIIICGDFNIAHRDIDLKKSKIYDKSGFSDKERFCMDKFVKKGYIDTYRYIHGEKNEAYTWWSYRSKGREKNEGWRIDYIFISEDLKDSLLNAFILDEIEGSDHCPIGIELKLYT
ncbi:exodeoxyribonuclease III [Arcobacter sp. LA11]|uniref:exodeoxyribonuclease III n=1 Tax=Arcobacter sp. LA11 TaxID=1898176 RepID=UPI000932E18A|nr:exodeoxyribonuclease III [Arcobacter sp. LA11]